MPAIAFGGAIIFQQFFKRIIGTKYDPIQWIINCVMNIKTGGCKVPEAIQNERSFLVTAKKLVIEEMTMEAGWFFKSNYFIYGNNYPRGIFNFLPPPVLIFSFLKLLNLIRNWEGI